MLNYEIVVATENSTKNSIILDEKIGQKNYVNDVYLDVYRKCMDRLFVFFSGLMKLYVVVGVVFFWVY